MFFFYFLNFDYFPNITITSIFTCLISMACVHVPFLHFWKSLDKQGLKNLIPILLKSYVSSILLASSVAVVFEFLQGFFFTDINIFELYLMYLILLPIVYISFYIKLIYFPDLEYRVVYRDPYDSISSQDNDEKREAYISTLKQQQIEKKRQKWLLFKKIVVYSFCVFCFFYFLLAIIVAYIMFG